MVEPPYFQANIEGEDKDYAYRTLQGAMAAMEKPGVTGTIYFVPEEGDIALAVVRYFDGEIEEDATTLVKPAGQ